MGDTKERKGGREEGRKRGREGRGNRGETGGGGGRKRGKRPTGRQTAGQQGRERKEKKRPSLKPCLRKRAQTTRCSQSTSQPTCQRADHLASILGRPRSCMPRGAGAPWRQAPSAESGQKRTTSTNDLTTPGASIATMAGKTSLAGETIRRARSRVATDALRGLKRRRDNAETAAGGWALGGRALCFLPWRAGGGEKSACLPFGGCQHEEYERGVDQPKKRKGAAIDAGRS